MATRFYLHNSAAPYSPASFKGAWNATGSAVTKALDASNSPSTTQTSVGAAETSTDTEYDVLLFRGVSGKLKAGTIGTGTVDVLIPVSENNVAANFNWHVHIYVTQGDSDSVRGTLLADYRESAGTNEWTDGGDANRYGTALNTSQSLSSVVVSDNDRIVVELGYTARNSVATSYAGYLTYGGASYAPELVVTGRHDLYGKGWVEFSETISTKEQARATQAAIEVLVDTGATSQARVTQAPVEVLVDTGATSQARVTQAPVEVLVLSPPTVRFYLANVAAPFTPTNYRGAWDATASSVTKALYGWPKGTTQTSVGIAETSTTNNWDVLLGRFVSSPVDAQTISGTISGYLVCLENNGAANDMLHLHVYVTAGDTDTVRGTLLTDYIGTEFHTTRRGLFIPKQTLTPVTASAGDRIVVEIGYQAQNTSATSYTGTIVYGADSDVVDVYDATTTFASDAASYSPWLEFDNLVLTSASELRVSQIVSEVSNSSPATDVQLLVSQLVAEASNASPSAGVRASQFVIEAVENLTSPAIRASQVVVEVPTTPQSEWVYTPSTGSLTIEGNQPTIVVEELVTGVTVQPLTGALVIEGQQAIVTVGPCIVPETGALVIEGQQPDVRVNHLILPQTGALVIEGQQAIANLYPVGWLVSQVVIEAASKSTASSTGYITQVVSEALSEAVPPSAQAGQIVVEEVSQFPTIYAQVSQVVIEVLCAGFIWVDIPDFVRVRLSSIDFPGGSGIVRAWCWARNATTTMYLRLWDITNSRVAGESPEVRQGSPTEVNFDVSIASGTAIYKLQMTANESKVDLFALGTLRKGGSAGGTEYPPVTPPPPPTEPPVVERQHPSWWLEYDASLTGPYSEGCHHLEGYGTVYYYWWVGITTIVNGREGPMKFAGDWGWHYPDDPRNIAGFVSWEAEPGATAYRVYMFNCTSHANGQLFDPHTNYQNLGVAYWGETSPNMYPAVSIHFKEVPASPENYSGIWGIAGATHQCIFYSETDGIEWKEWA